MFTVILYNCFRFTYTNYLAIQLKHIWGVMLSHKIQHYFTVFSTILFSCYYCTNILKMHKLYFIFQNLYEGSKGYKLLEDQAKQYYLTNIDEYLSSPSISERIKTILDGVTEDQLKQLKTDVHDLKPADDEKWLDVSPADLDHILEQKFGLSNCEQPSTSNTASSFTDKIRSFLNRASDINGTEFSLNHLRQVYSCILFLCTILLGKNDSLLFLVKIAIIIFLLL